MKIKDFIKETNGSYILEKVLNKDKTWLFLNDELEVPKEAIEILDKVKSGYPIEYLFEEVYFYGDKFYIKEGVLIPRDDTEVVVEKAINIVNKFQVPGTKLRVVDCCTGSGVIAIEIAKHTNAKVIATDISDKALEVAKENVKLYFLNVEIKKCDLFDFSGDILVSNPPYVAREDLNNLPDGIKNFEPVQALDGGEKGLEQLVHVFWSDSLAGIPDLDEHIIFFDPCAYPDFVVLCVDLVDGVGGVDK
jgi:release factor glutamine methyltransferase